MLQDCGQGVSVAVHNNGAEMAFEIVMNCCDNRFNVDFCEALSAALDFVDAQVQANQEHKFALLIRGAGKFFSNGLDLKYLLKLPDPHSFLKEIYQPLIERFLTLGMSTIAVLDGHAFAAGFVLALAQDYRVAAASSKALFCMNELLIRAAVPSGMMGVLKAKLGTPQLLRECIFAKRWNVHQAKQDGIIDAFVEADQLIAFARSKAIPFTQTAVLKGIKQETYREAVALLTDPKLNALDPFRFVLPNKL